MKNFYTTTPIYYASGRLHIGSSSSTLLCDSLKRFKRMMGYDTFFLTGMDEHGEKVEKKAKANNVTPQEFTDELAERAKRLWKKIDCDYDGFIRTTDSKHMAQVQEVFERMLEKGDIYLGEYDGLYCTECETFFTLSDVGEKKLCPDCGREVRIVKEPSYFFRLSKYQDQLLKFIDEHPDFITPEAKKNEVVSFVKSGLQDLSVSRSTFSWGIPIKSDPKHVVYVWLDALFNYLTNLDFLSEDKSKYEKYWLNAEVIHVVAKDILRFHAVFWPIFLMSMDIPVNFKLFAHSWILMYGEKMSKSKGNVIFPASFVKRYGVDAYRYYILREFPVNQDMICTPEDFISRYNSELVNDYGNLVSRTVSMGLKYFEGTVNKDEYNNEFAIDLKNMVNDTISSYKEYMNSCRTDKALEEVNKLISRTNKFIDETLPWALFKENKLDELNNVLYYLLESIRVSTILYEPFLVNTYGKVYNSLGIENKEYTIDEIKPFETNEYHVNKLEETLFPRENDIAKAVEEIIVDMKEELTKNE